MKKQELFAVIDTETNWDDEVMSIGLVIADKSNFCVVDRHYYVIDPEFRCGGMCACALEVYPFERFYTRKEAIADIRTLLVSNNVSSIFAYNATFDCSHLPELRDFEWYDIMRIAAYRQYNKKITPDMECCSTGRLKRNFGVESILKLLLNEDYFETHNAMLDAEDELQIIKLLGCEVTQYKCARIN